MAERLTRVFPDRRDPTRIVHSLADMFRARMFAICQTEVGLVTTIGGLLGLAVQTPIGAAIDETRAKRLSSSSRGRASGRS